MESKDNIMRYLIGICILMSCFYSCSDNDHEKIRQEMDQIADQEEAALGSFEVE